MNLFLVACPRAGSTQLAAWLASHPEIGLSSIKEPNFFASEDFPPSLVSAQHLNDVDPGRYFASGVHRPVQFAVLREACHYARLVAGMTTKWRMDASTAYLSCPGAAARIQAYNPNARILLLTRDPVARALSHYHLALRTGRTRQSLGDELDDELASTHDDARHFLLRPSRYQAGVQAFRQAFPGEQIHALDLTELAEEPERVLADIARFLDMAPRGFDLTRQARNQGALPRLPAVNHWLQKTGLKTRIRAALPARLKPHLRRLWFNTSADVPIAARDVERLTMLLERQP